MMGWQWHILRHLIGHITHILLFLCGIADFLNGITATVLEWTSFIYGTPVKT